MAILGNVWGGMKYLVMPIVFLLCTFIALKAIAWGVRVRRGF